MGPCSWPGFGPGTGARALTCGFRLTRAMKVGVDTAVTNPARHPACRGCDRPVLNGTAPLGPGPVAGPVGGVAPTTARTGRTGPQIARGTERPLFINAHGGDA